jgi:hypothetical protein
LLQARTLWGYSIVDTRAVCDKVPEQQDPHSRTVSTKDIAEVCLQEDTIQRAVA